ncbi:MAG: response regulator [Prevotella sp.]|nr:response regulator [Prevotella sp.]
MDLTKRLTSDFCKLTVLLWGMLLACPAAIGANYSFTRIASNEGLSEQCVKSIVQDHWGFLWFGTKNGLNRWDGRQVKRYDVDDLERGCGNHNISALYEDADHRLWAGTDRGVYIMDPMSERFTLFDVSTDEGVQIKNWIAQITGDSQGCIWVVSPNEGAFRYNPQTGHMSMYRTAKDATSPHLHNPECMLVRQNGDIWLGTNGAGLFRLDQKTGQLWQMLEDRDGHSLSGKNIYVMAEQGDWIIVGEHEGMLMKYNPTTNVLTEVQAPNVHYKVIRTLAVDGDDLFVGTQDGLYIVNEHQGRETIIRENDFVPSGLTDNLIYSLYLDRDRGLWVGTMMSGACYLPRHGMQFTSYLPMGTPSSLHSKRLRDLLRVSDGDVWISDEEGGLSIFHSATQTIEQVPVTIYKGGSNRLGLMELGDDVWSGIFKNGLDIVNKHSHRITHYSPEQLGLGVEGSVYAMLCDSRGNIWLGTGNGVYRHSGGMRFTRVDALPDIFTQDLAEDGDGQIWIATMGSGVFRLDPQTLRTEHFYYEEGSTEGISSNGISSITVGKDKSLWFSTDRGGICMYSPQTKAWTRYSKADGLPDDVAYKILEDRKGRLWFGTNQGLVRFEPQSRQVLVYRSNNGLLGNQFNYKSAAKAADGLFLFGGTSGLISFQPRLADADSTSQHVFITNLRVNEADVRPGEGGILKTNILHTREITLPYDVASIGFDLSTLNFSGTESRFLEYQMGGLTNEWTTTQTGRDISYSQLQPGKYTFRVRPVGDPDHLTELHITVRHPWWSSIPAKIVYFLLAALLAYVVYRLIQRRQAETMKAREAHFREEQDKELLQAKINFFTDITHEIRTPLTLINGSVENLKDISIEDNALKKNIGAIEKNTRRLLNLINQLLDFRKVESNSMQLSFVNIDFGQLLQSIVARFEPTISGMHKTISLDLKDDDLRLQADQEAVTKIVSNLLNNARKYSETFIQVTARNDGDRMELRVTNDGDQIPAEKAEAIFQPFTRLDDTHNQPGSGLGLPMARSLAELHGGSLAIDTRSEYNEFVLTLPLKQQLTQPQPLAEREESIFLQDDHASAELSAPLTAKEAPGVSQLHTVLIVEDNEEVLSMIAEGLQKHYNVLRSKNGLQGLHKAQNEHVDLIVTDVMMPEMDGLEMTRRLKEDVETSHIPIIMLTAKQTLDNRLEGLRAGADAYIEKPFSFAHLLTQLETLLTNRQRERESFIKKPYLPVQSNGISKVEEQFISKITELIIQHIRQPEFNVEQLASEMCMSRSSLHRKIKEVSDMTPIDFIRLIRLKKAAELIRERGYRANEVCEMVGINSPSYFIKLFQKQFGMTPKEFANQKE